MDYMYFKNTICLYTTCIYLVLHNLPDDKSICWTVRCLSPFSLHINVCH